MFKKPPDITKGFFRTILHNQPNSRTELVEVLHEVAAAGVIDANSVPAIEAILRMDRLRAKDIMLPRHKMDVLNINDDMDKIIQQIAQTSHSRFPVIDDGISDIIGVFHAKDLLNYFLDKDAFNLRDALRQPYFVPEIKPLDALMFEMRVRQTHMAIIVDEFTNIVGLVTLEMIVENIVGEIEDEHDLIDLEREIIKLTDKTFRLKGYCKINDLNLFIDSGFNDPALETVGGYLIKSLNRIPVPGEILDFDKFQIEIIDSDSRKIKLLILSVK